MKNKELLIFLAAVSIIYGEKTCQAQSINTSYSTINFPYNLAYINATRPTITGSLLDDNRKAVRNETVDIFINGTLIGFPFHAIGTTASNNDGIYEFQLEQDLPDGQYVVTVFCVESKVSLNPNIFIVDTTLPPVAIVHPRENEAIEGTPFITSGTTEENAMIETFLDNDTYGLLCYADQSGNWSVEYSASVGSHIIRAQATDIAGNQGPLSEIRSFIII